MAGLEFWSRFVTDTLLCWEMEVKNDFLRLIYPQWQGGNISSWFPDMKAHEVSKGYFLGSHLLNFLCPATQNQIEVPVSLSQRERIETDGILDKDQIVEQIKATLEILKIKQPDRVATLGGECSVSVPVFSYFADRYGDQTGIVWLDAHPDITLPGDPYNGFHAMALAACLGEGDRDINGLLPGKFKKENVLTVGVRNFERQQIVDRFNEWKLRNLTVEEINRNPGLIDDWIAERHLNKIVIHLDLDVLEPTELQTAVGHDSNGLTIDNIIRCIEHVRKAADIVSITVAEPMPIYAILLQKLLRSLPLLDL